jgi:hypothetical protein
MMDFDLIIDYCEYDWFVDPGVIWLCWGIGWPGEYAIYQPYTFPPPCTAGNYTGIIGEN